MKLTPDEQIYMVNGQSFFCYYNVGTRRAYFSQPFNRESFSSFYSNILLLSFP